MSMWCTLQIRSATSDPFDRSPKKIGMSPSLPVSSTRTRKSSQTRRPWHYSGGGTFRADTVIDPDSESDPGGLGARDSSGVPARLAAGEPSRLGGAYKLVAAHMDAPTRHCQPSRRSLPEESDGDTPVRWEAGVVMACRLRGRWAVPQRRGSVTRARPREPPSTSS